MEMKKRANGFLIAVLLAVMSFLAVFSDAMTATAAEGDLTLKLHYHREDGIYDDWDLYLWETDGGKEGGGFPFETEEGDSVVATKVLSAGVTKVGFIVRRGGDSWQEKDIDEDQFIDVAEVSSGTVHIYVESKVKGFTKEYGEDAVLGLKVRSAAYNGDGTVTVTMTGELDAETDLKSVFSVTGKDGDVAVSEVREGENFTYILVLAEELDPFKSYTITYGDASSKISIPNVYSTDGFEQEYTYAGDDLGATWTQDATTFRVWAPTAESVTLKLYESGNGDADDLKEEIGMAQAENGTWVAKVDGDLNGVYYTYSVAVDGVTNEACDPYARTTGVNGARAMVINLDATNPDGWESDTNPHAGESINDAVIYELHVRDLSIAEDSGITNKGKFLGLTETGTKTAAGVSTGLDHIRELGVTHVHLLPVYDFGSVDETGAGNQFNWGYDPVNYNVPEGSYSTDPYNGEVRVAEFKEAVKALHDNGISVVMDVVYNHVQDSAGFCFNKLVPGYFSRINEDGTYSNGSGCGNDTASERSMVRKYIVDSVCYWADEYHIDGFRFDLVGLLDTETINEIVTEVHKNHPDVIFYGEGWSMSTNLTKEGYTMATQVNSELTPGFAYFNDSIRDSLKGSVFDHNPGYVSGKGGLEETLASNFLGAASWCSSPAQTINYASCHDNLTLFDRLQVSTDAGREDLIKMNNLAAAFYMTAEGVPFMQAGEEMLRTKENPDGTLVDNSYNAGDEVNRLRWSDLEDSAYAQVYEYYKGLIAFRRAHGALRLTTAEEVAATVSRVEGLEANVLAFDIQGGVNGETADELFVIFNPNENSTRVELPEGNWNIYVNGEKAGTQVLASVTEGSVTVEPITAMVLVKEEAEEPAPTEKPDEPVSDGWKKEEDGNLYWYEDGVKQGTEGRGKEIYDSVSDAWYWLDAVDGGKMVVNKDVYQESLAGRLAENMNGTGKWVRYDADGHMVKGWDKAEEGSWYFDPVYGTMAKGYVVIEGELYVFDRITGIGTGEPCKWEEAYGWVTLEDGSRYWYEEGVKQGTEGRGKEIYDPVSDAWYWLDAVDGGKAAVSKDVYQESLAGDWAENPDGTGKWVRYDENGHMVKDWNITEEGTWYFDPVYGTMAKGTVTIDGKEYQFDRVTGILAGEPARN